MIQLTDILLTLAIFFFQNPQGEPFYQIMRAAHVVKGAAANLMCQSMRHTAMQLEDAARRTHESGGMAAPADMQATVQARFLEMQQASQQYFHYLQTIGV
jgi:HPt (histidine-containing phosphotransfer) domain-containing protein